MTDAHCHVSGGDPSVRELLIGRDFVGVHPWAALGEEMGRIGAEGGIGAGGFEGVCAWLREKLLANPRLGVGEIGLDRLKEKAISPAMRELFVAQLALAFEFRRPVVLHGAKCWGEVVKQITVNSEQRTDSVTVNSEQRTDSVTVNSEQRTDSVTVNSEQRTDSVTVNSEQRTDSVTVNTEQRTVQDGSSWVPPDQNASATTSVHCSLFTVHSAFLFHGFSRSDGLLPDIVRLNGYVSVGPAVLNDHAVNYRELVKKIPLDRLLVETDRDCAPEELLNPVTKAPLTIRDVLEKTAELRGLSLAELESVTDANAARFF